MVEVDALTAARRARQRRKKELQRHGQAVLRRVLGVALLSAAALLYGASSGYTDHGNKEFGSGAGMLYGVGVVALPGTIVDLARFIAAGLWLLSVVVVGWVSRRRLKRIDEERLAAAKDDDDGEDPVLLT